MEAYFLQGILLMKKTLIALLSLLFSVDALISASIIDPDVYTILEQSFPSIPKEQWMIQVLKGGLSGTALYKIETPTQQYVLRLHQSTQLSSQDEREHFALIEAAKLGIAPHVAYVSSDNRAILMEFVNHKTLTLEKAKLPENIVKIACAIRKAHEIVGHPHVGESLLSNAHRCHEKVLKDGLGTEENINGALELIKRYREQLSAYACPQVNVHGDLNPRNIFLTDDNGVLLIDWAESSLEDPFYDLTYFALKHDYDEVQETLLLKTYLQRQPTVEETSRFTLQKKIHQAFWSLTNLYLADVQLRKHPQQKIDPQASLKSWSTYQKTYADSMEELPAQYFYELSRLNYQLAL